VKNPRILFALIFIALCACFLVSISLGSVYIPLKDTVNILFGGEGSQDSWSYIIWNYRIPKAFTAVLVGTGLSLSGLLMQTLFRNPLAGPFVLGISSGASLGAALLIMGSGIITYFSINNLTLALAASFGSFLVLLVVMLVASRIKDTMALLIIGLMFGSITAALVSILAYFTDAEKLQQYIFWTFGSVGNLSANQLLILGGVITFGILLSIMQIKPLNALLLGENYAISMGITLKKTRLYLIIATGLLAGAITAFAGPIAFIGLAVPHLTRQLFASTNHSVLIPAVCLYGAILMLICDILAQIPGSIYVLPINAVTALIGAPVVIWLLVKRQKMIF